MTSMTSVTSMWLVWVTYSIGMGSCSITDRRSHIEVPIHQVRYWCSCSCIPWAPIRMTWLIYRSIIGSIRNEACCIETISTPKTIWTIHTIVWGSRWGNSNICITQMTVDASLIYCICYCRCHIGGAVRMPSATYRITHPGHWIIPITILNIVIIPMPNCSHSCWINSSIRARMSSRDNARNCYARDSHCDHSNLQNVFLRNLSTLIGEKALELLFENWDDFFLFHR